MKKINLPNNVEADDGAAKHAENILRAGKVIISYLRKWPTVDVIKEDIEVFVNVEGQELPYKVAEYSPEDPPEDAVMEGHVAKIKKKTIHRRVICSGVPYACLIAFLAGGDQLRIGWSKRLEAKEFADGEELERDLEEADDFMEMYKLLSGALRDIEVPFSKKNGRIAAIIRGLNDEIVLNGKGITSKQSGVIPSDVVARLRPFTLQVEKAFGKTAVNVKQKQE